MGWVWSVRRIAVRIPSRHITATEGSLVCATTTRPAAAATAATAVTAAAAATITAAATTATATVATAPTAAAPHALKLMEKSLVGEREVTALDGASFGNVVRLMHGSGEGFGDARGGPLAPSGSRVAADALQLAQEAQITLRLDPGWRDPSCREGPRRRDPSWPYPSWRDPSKL